jgi:hypothetical protein
MADHCRKQIRDALVAGSASLSTVLTVHAGRVVALDPADLPALLVFTNEETVEKVNRDGDQTRILVVTVEAHVQGTGVVDTLDAIAAEAEPLIFANLPAWVKDADLISTSTELTGEAVQPAGIVRLEYTVKYHVNRAAPDMPL